MKEAVTAQLLAAAAGASAMSGLFSALPRNGRGPSLGSLPLRRGWIWVGVPGAIGLLSPGPKVLTVPLAIAVGWRAQRLVEARRHAHHRAVMDREVPQLLDLMAAGSAAGLSAIGAFRRAVDGLRGPLGKELHRTVAAVDLGARWHDELSRAAERLALPDLHRAITVLGRTQTLGSSLADATRDLAADVRGARRSAIAERARSAPVKMLFPLVFLILPAFLLLTVVPVLLTTVRSIR